MATRDTNSVKRVGLTVILVLTLLITPAFATSWVVHEAQEDTDVLFNATLALSIDIGRAPIASEWPNILVSAPAIAAEWHGPYVHHLVSDAWGQPFALRFGVAGPETFGVYSFGVNRVDEHGAGDDVSSWAGFDRRFYSFREPGDWFVLFVIPLLLLLPIAWLVFCVCKSVAAWMRLGGAHPAGLDH